MNEQLKILSSADYSERIEYRGSSCCLIVNNNLKEDKCMFGFVDLENDFEAAKGLFEKAERRAKELGFRRLFGPMNYNTWMSYRWALNDFDVKYFPDCDNENIGLPYEGLQVPREAVCGDGGASCEQEFHGHGAADDVGCSDNNCVHTLDVIESCRADHGHDSFRGAGAERGDPLAEPSDVIWMESVNVLCGDYSLDDFGRVDLLGHGELHQDPVDCIVSVELVDEIENFLLGGLCRKIIGLGDKSAFLAGLSLVADIDL